ncbi:WD40 repeat-like protein [Cystobasidium minutum MCA 4210]|uniref:WD40 repeat-like protein n=1 Tax=Cystobasidium minutum MCA 4210 TaxID=1397322 RepID=UPI0034CDA20A|eukprot:jgi/Rhomi1/193038/gm1.1252_g
MEEEEEAAIVVQDEASSQTYQQPKVNLDSKPSVLTSLPAETGERSDNFWRNAKWAPDGSCILTHEEHRLAKIFALPTELVDISTNFSLRQHLAVPTAPAALLGLEWFPFASLSRPETFCFVRSVRDLPVQLIDGNTGRVRASYSIIDHQERFVGPNSMTFSPDGMKLYCGFENAIECFDVANPGATGTRHMLSPSRKAKQGQKGLISSIALSLDNSGLMAAGSFTKSLYLYDASGGEPRLIRSLKSKDPSHRGAGVTQVNFHPTMPNYVYSTSRRMNHILVWDIRNPSDVMLALPRPGNTHQRIHFDIDPWGKWLTTGDTNGDVRFYDTHDPDGDMPAAVYHLAEDTVSSAMLHPLQPLLLTASGSRRFPVASRSASFSDSSSESDSDDSLSSPTGDDIETREKQSPTRNTPAVRNTAKSALSLWSLQ